MSLADSFYQRVADNYLAEKARQKRSRKETLRQKGASGRQPTHRPINVVKEKTMSLDYDALAKAVSDRMNAQPLQQQLAGPPPLTAADVERELDLRDAAKKQQQDLAAAVRNLAPAIPPPAATAPLNTLTTGQKIARGLAESAPARGTVVNANPLMEQNRLAREKRLALSGQGGSRASMKIAQGLAESSPSRGPTRPAA